MISPSVGDGTVTLKSMKILKVLEIHGGGSHSVRVDGCDIKTTLIQKDGGEAIRLMTVDSRIGYVDIRSDSILDGDADSDYGEVKAHDSRLVIKNGGFDRINTFGNGVVRCEGGTVESILVSDGSTAGIEIQNCVVDDLILNDGCTIDVHIAGNGSVGTMNYGHGVSVNTSDSGTDEKLSGAGHKMSDGNGSGSIIYNGAERHIDPGKG